MRSYTLTGAEALIKSLLREEVQIIFGQPGMHLMEAIDAIHRVKGIRWITVRHEQSAAYMAFGYARSTGKVGVAMVLPGPGALNAAAGIGTAYAASTPVLLISSQIESKDLGQKRGVVHEIDDQLDIFRTITKWCYRVRHPDEIPDALRKAMHHAATGRQRPVELEIPMDFMQASVDVEIPGPEPRTNDAPDIRQIKKAAEALKYAKRPLILAGGGVISADAQEETTRLAERLNAPVITTREGKGSIPGNHPLCLGVTYWSTGDIRNILLQADVILAVGSRCYFPGFFQPEQKIIQVDIDPTEVGRNQHVYLGLTADARLALTSLLEHLPERGYALWAMDDINKIKEKATADFEKHVPIQSSIIQTLREELSEDAILVPDNTNIGYWSHQTFPVLHPRTYITSSYFVTVGYAFPTALGAKIGNPDRQVIALCGDGGLMFSLPELATAVQEGINVVILVFVNKALGLILRDQELRFDGRIIGTRMHVPDFARVAECFGAKGIKLSHHNEFRDGLRAALSEDRPTVVEVPLPDMLTPSEIAMRQGIRAYTG